MTERFYISSVTGSITYKKVSPKTILDKTKKFLGVNLKGFRLTTIDVDDDVIDNIPSGVLIRKATNESTNLQIDFFQDHAAFYYTNQSPESSDSFSEIRQRISNEIDRISEYLDKSRNSLQNGYLFSGLIIDGYVSLDDNANATKNIESKFIKGDNLDLFDVEVKLTTVVENFYYINWTIGNSRKLQNMQKNNRIHFKLDVNSRYAQNFQSANEEIDTNDKMIDVALGYLEKGF